MLIPKPSLRQLTVTIGVGLSALHLSFGAAGVARAQPKQDKTPLPVHVKEHPNLVYTRYGDRAMHVDLFVPTGGTTPKPAVLVVHGGGWLKGSKEKFRRLAVALAARGYVAAAVEYRLGGEAKFPAAIHDCHAAVRWLRTNAKEYGVDPRRIGAVGGSAGGHLVGLLAVSSQVEALTGIKAQPSPSSALQAAVVMAGPLELATGPVAEKSRKQPDQSNSNHWLGKTVDEAPQLYRLASATTHISKATPPILFMAGEHDNPGRNLATRRKLKGLGIATGVMVYKDGKHGCWNRDPWFTPMVDDIDGFLRSTLKIESGDEYQGSTDDGGELLLKRDWGEIHRRRTGLVLRVSRRPTNGVLAIPRFNNPIGDVAILPGKDRKDPIALALKPGTADWSIALPGTAMLITPFDVFVETKGTPYLPIVPRVVSESADGRVVLAAHDAVTHGRLLRFEPQPKKNTVGYWANRDDWCAWHLYVDEPGKFRVHVLQGCGKGQGGSKVDVRVADQAVAFTVEDTGHFQNFKDREVGAIALASPGVHTLRIRAVSKAAKAVMDVRQVQLVRVTGAE